MASSPLSTIVSKEMAPGPTVMSDADILDIRATAISNYHPCSTARMGRADDPMAVLTPDLKVKGVEALRVMDASAFPKTISANTNAPTMALADRGIDIMMGLAHPLQDAAAANDVAADPNPDGPGLMSGAA
jgi:choline dehydrogenase